MTMPLILNIDTASEKAHISIARNGQVLQARNNDAQKEHASFLQAAVQDILNVSGINIKEIDAVAVTAGPGSYTGLRVGFASAKGFCYALKKPFITISTLEILTASALEALPAAANLLYCPMMDARRMEVFTAVYDQNLDIILDPCAMVLNGSSFEKELSNHKIVFFGNGSTKWEQLCKHPNAAFSPVSISPEAFSKRSNILFEEKIFAELAYSEPFYLKEFQSVI